MRLGGALGLRRRPVVGALRTHRPLLYRLCMHLGFSYRFYTPEPLSRPQPRHRCMVSSSGREICLAQHDGAGQMPDCAWQYRILGQVGELEQNPLSSRPPLKSTMHDK